MKKFIILAVVSVFGFQAQAENYKCSIVTKNPVVVDGEETTTLHSRAYISGNMPVKIYENEKTSIVLSENASQNTWQIISYDRSSGDILARAVAEHDSKSLQVLDYSNQQSITCKRMPLALDEGGAFKLAPRYVRSSGEGGGLGDPTPPPASGCWIISCAY